MSVWLLTSTFYGTWLPGDSRGFVGRVRDQRHEPPARHRREHDAFGTEYDRHMPGLHRSALRQLKGSPIELNLEQAGVLFHQFQETTQYRQWALHAVAIMANHVHCLVTLPEDLHGREALLSYKSYGSRALSRAFGVPASGTWWTSRGSARLKANPAAQRAAWDYVRDQANALLIWCDAVAF